MQANTYLFFNGNCKEAFETYARVLGARIDAMLTHAGTPAESHTPPEWRDKILHAKMSIGNTTLMASDAPPGHQAEKFQGFSVNVSVSDLADAERIFHALSEGGKVNMPFAETFWARGFGMLVDRFGIPWMVNCEKTGAVGKTA
ncbi:MAG TPA: VOC family protein [Terriglobales bacterium]|nr:VOC family protein [Terriglobales bacterium]